MSRIAGEESITCPGCAERAPFPVWSSVNVTLDPPLRVEVLSGSLTRFTCPGCGTAVQVVYPFLYHDMRQRLLVWVLPHGEEPEEIPPFLPADEGYAYRHVASYNELIEKILLRDAGLDDRVAECLKTQLQIQLEDEAGIADAELYFDGLEGEGGEARIRFTLLTPAGAQSVEIDARRLERLAADLAPLLRSRPLARAFARVDRRHALELLSLRVRQLRGEAGV